MENKTGSDAGRGFVANQFQQAGDSSVYDPEALSLKATSLTSREPADVAAANPLSSGGFSHFMRNFLILLGVLLLVGMGGIFWLGSKAGKNQSNNAALNGQTNTVEIPLSGLDVGDLGATENRSVAINGPLTLNDTFVLTPQAQPVQAVAGQMYYDQASNKLNYYNGAKFVALDAGVLSITSGNQLMSVSDDGSGNIVLTAKPTITSGGVTSAGGATGKIIKFTGTSTIGNSLLSDDGTTVTVAGNLSVTGSVGLSTPLSVASGGTGANSVTLNGVVLGGGTGALTAVTAAGPGLCFVSTAGAPAFQACPGGVGSAFTQDGNSFAAQATLGTNDANTLAFETNNATQATIAVGGAATFQNSANSAAAFRVLSSGGTPIVTVSTTGNAVIVQGTGTAGSGSSLQFGNDGNLSIGEAAGNSDILTYNARVSHAFAIDSTTVATFTQNGGLQIDASNSFGGLYVADNIGHNTLTVVGDGSSVQIGYAFDNVADQLVVDTKLSAGDPTGINGGMYYNASSSKLRCFEGSAWKDCVDSTAGSAFVQGGNSFGALATLGTNDANDLAIERNNVTQLTVGNGNVTLANNVNLLLQGTTAYVSNSLGKTRSEFFGAGATFDLSSTADMTVVGNGSKAGDRGTSVGSSINNTANDSVAIGANITLGAAYATAVGAGTSAGGESVSLGVGANSTGGNSSIALGAYATTTASNQLVIGSNNDVTHHISQVVIGSGVTDTTPNGFTLQGTGGSGANVAGASVTIAGGQGTGNALGGSIVFQSSLAGGSGSSLNGLSTLATLSTTSLTMASDMDIFLQGTGAQISNPQGQSNSEAFGLSALVGGNDSVAVGKSASTASESVAIGSNAGSNNFSVAVGSHATANSSRDVAIGAYSWANGGTATSIGTSASSSFLASVALGYCALTTADNQFVVGGDTINCGGGGGGATVNQMVVGNGVTNATPLGFTLQGTSGLGSDVAGASTTIAAGQGTGSALGGSIIFQTSAAGVSGSSLNALSTVGTFSSSALTLGTNIDLLLQGTTAYISNSQGQANAEAFGLNASVGDTETLAVGNGAQALSQGAIALGYNAVANGFGSPVAIGEGAIGTGWGVAIGEGANSGSNFGVAIGNNAAASLVATAIGGGAVAQSGGIAIGESATTGGNDRIVIGNGATATADRQLILGGPSSAGYINDVYFGSGVTDPTPVTVTLNASGGNGTNVAGADLILDGGKGTGSANGGNIGFQISAPGGSGSGLNGLTTVATISGANGGASFQNAVNSTSAFSIQNANGTQLLKVNSIHNTNDLVTNGSIEQNTTGWAGKGSATISRITSQQYIGTASLQVGTTASGDGAKYSIMLSSSTQYTVQFWAKLSSGTFTNMSFGYSSDGSTDTDCKTNQTVKTGGWAVYNCTFTTGTISGSPYFYWKQNSAVSRTVYTDALQIVPGPDVGAFYEGKIDTSGLAFSGPVAIQNDNDSQAALQVQSAGGTTVFGVDSLNFRVGINLIQPTAALHVVTIGNNSVTALFNQAGSSTQDILQLAKATNTTVAVAHDGTTTFQVLTDSTSAFRVLSSNATFGSGTPQFVVDTSNSRVYIGNPTGDTTGALLVLDTKTGSGDPTGVNGGMYYNSNANKFRCYEHNNWKNCLGFTQNLTLFGLNGNGSASTWTNMPSAETEFMVGVTGIANAANRVKYDLSDAEQIRFQVNVESAGSTNAELRIQYSTDQSTWNYLDNGNTGLGQNVSTTGLKVSSWSDIAGGAKGDVYLRMTGINGDGAADPDFGLIQLQIR